MEKEELVSRLQKEVGNTNLSERSFKEYVEQVFPDEGVEIDDAFVTKHSNILKSFAGQLRSDVSSALKTALPDEVKRYLEKNPDYIKDYIAKHPNPNDPPKDDEKLAELEKQLGVFKQAFEAQQKEARYKDLRKSATDKLVASGLSYNSGIWDEAVNAVTIADEATADDVFNLAKAKYDEKCKKYGIDGGKPKNTLGGGNGGDDSFVDAYFKKKFKKK